MTVTPTCSSSCSAARPIRSREDRRGSGQTQQAIRLRCRRPRGLQQQATPGPPQQAIEQDHDGSILDDISGYLNGTANLSPRTTDGEGILGHVLGDKQQPVAQALGSQTGLNSSTIMSLLPLLAPIVMGMLGKQARSGSNEGGGLGDLGSILGGLGGLAADGRHRRRRGIRRARRPARRDPRRR